MPQNHVAALKALKAGSIVGATYFPDKLNAVFAGYLRDAGIDVLAMDGVDVPFDKVQELPSRPIYAHIKRSFQKHKKAEAIYMLGSGWRTLDIIAKLERELGVPVVHPVTGTRLGNPEAPARAKAGHGLWPAAGDLAVRTRR